MDARVQSRAAHGWFTIEVVGHRLVGLDRGSLDADPRPAADAVDPPAQQPREPAQGGKPRPLFEHHLIEPSVIYRSGRSDLDSVAELAGVGEGDEQGAADEPAVDHVI